MAINKTDLLQFEDEFYEIIPPAPSETERGGIIASPKTSADTVEAKLGDDGKLYVEPTKTDLSNYYDKSEVDMIADELNEAIENHTHDVDDELSITSTNPVQNQAVTNWLAENVKNYSLQLQGSEGSRNLYLSNSNISVAADAPTDGNESGYVINTIEWHQLGVEWDNITDIPSASTSQKGIVQLTNSTTSTSTTTAATPSSVKSALDAAKSHSNSNLATAQSYADTAATNAANAVKNELLNGAGAAYDTLKELGELIDDNTTAIDALEEVATGKADKVHTHTASDITDLQPKLNELSDEMVRAEDDGNVSIADSSAQIVNQIPISTDDNGAIYNSIGYKNGIRWSSSAQAEASNSAYGMSGYIPCDYGDTVFLKDVTLTSDSSPYIVLFDSSKEYISVQSISISTLVPDANNAYSIVVNAHANVAFIRLSMCTFTNASIVTINQDFSLTGNAQIGWLLNSNGEKIAPRTLSSQVIRPDGTNIDNYIEEKSTLILNESKDYTDAEVAKKANSSHNHSISDVTNLQTKLDEVDASIEAVLDDCNNCDLVIYATKSLYSQNNVNSMTKDDFTIIKGNVANILSRIENNQSVNVQLISHVDNGDTFYTLYKPNRIYYNGEVNRIVFNFKVLSTSESDAEYNYFWITCDVETNSIYYFYTEYYNLSLAENTSKVTIVRWE